jgi:hypothetical protein
LLGPGFAWLAYRQLLVASFGAIGPSIDNRPNFLDIYGIIRHLLLVLYPRYQKVPSPALSSLVLIGKEAEMTYPDASLFLVERNAVALKSRRAGSLKKTAEHASKS